MSRFSPKAVQKIALLCGTVAAVLAMGEVVARILHARDAALGIAGVPDVDDALRGLGYVADPEDDPETDPELSRPSDGR